MTNLQYNNPKDELDLIEGAVRGLENRAEELKNIQILIEKLSQMGVEFKEEGKNINKAGAEFIETTKQCKDLLGAEFNSLKDSYEEDSKSLNNYIIKWSKIVHDVGESIEKIDRVDFPSRLDKIDVTIASINQAIQNLQLKIENFEMNNKEFLKEKMQLIVLKQDQVFKKYFKLQFFK